MLVLSRRLNEKLLIPCIRTAVQVLSIQGGQVRLGVDAPPEVAVLREEIYKGDPRMEKEAPAVPRDRMAGLLRNRLARLALGLERLQRQVQAMAESAGARAALDQLGREFDELAHIVGRMPQDAAPTQWPACCS